MSDRLSRDESSLSSLLKERTIGTEILGPKAICREPSVWTHRTSWFLLLHGLILWSYNKEWNEDQRIDETKEKEGKFWGLDRRVGRSKRRMKGTIDRALISFLLCSVNWSFSFVSSSGQQIINFFFFPWAPLIKEKEMELKVKKKKTGNAFIIFQIQEIGKRNKISIWWLKMILFFFFLTISCRWWKKNQIFIL